MQRLSLIVTGFLIILLATPAMAQAQGPCFFIQPEYKGDPICIAPTQKLPSLGPAAKNKLMSVQVPQGVRVTVCDGDNFGGSCQTLSQSVPNFTTIGAAGKVGSVASETGTAPPRAGAQPPAPPQPPRAQQSATQPPAAPPGPAATPPRPPQVSAPQPGQATPPPQAAPNDLAAAAARAGWDADLSRELRRQLVSLHKECEGGEKASCVRMGFIIGENRGRRVQWRQDVPELFWWDK